jgi:ABC-type multidrug transport system fused ATPase/permease subunit
MRVKEIITQSLANKVSTIILLIFSMIMAVVAEMFAVLIIRNLVDRVFVTSITENPRLALWVTLFVISLFTWFGMNILSKNKAISLGTYVSTSLSKAAHSACLRAELCELKKIDNKEIVSKLTADCSKIGERYIGESWVNFFSHMVFLIGAFITMMAINPALGLITYVTLPVFYMLVKTFGKFVERIGTKATTEITSNQKRLSENFEKISGIKLKNGVLHEEENFQKQSERYIRLKKMTGGLRDVSKSKLFTLFVGGVIALIFGVGGYISTRETIIPGTIVGFLLLIPFVFYSFKNIMNPRIGFRYITSEMASLEELLSLRSEIRAEPINSLEAINSLKFENVSYYSERGNLESLNFEVKTGEKLGVIALDDYSSDLIFGLITKIIRPKEGNISINNCDINKLNTFYLRDIVTGIPNEKTLFEDTIANNISYPLEFDEYKYNDALNRSGLKDFLSELESKDQTLLDEEFELNDELMQRISFANAFYKDSKIIVMNEATAGMNVKSEEALLKEIFKLKNKIIVLMSNKTYQIINCDKVLIIENERVLEYGAVSELLQDRSSVLSKMVKKVKANRGAKVS